MRQLFFAFIFVLLLFGCASQEKPKETEPKIEEIKNELETEIEDIEIPEELEIQNQTDLEIILDNGHEGESETEIIEPANKTITLYYGENVTIGSHYYVFCGYSAMLGQIQRTIIAFCEDGKQYKGIHMPIGQNVSLENQTLFVHRLFAADITKNESRNQSYIEVSIFG